MNRAFFPHGGFGRPFRPFPHPFFPGRFLFPFFFFSPFFFPFFREENGGDPNDYFAQHQAQQGDTFDKIAHMYNIPKPILEEGNPHIGKQGMIQPGSTVYIPRISHMYCHKTYIEREVEGTAQKQHGQNMPYPGVPY
ncbi:LysM peptidoglycan-binding domain-containing protein [Paenibacillus arenilitoris]|uniref:LysM peptidoglycan-binding domain-containing protein n=1 Tax=Paenibacillus arenilitoris TaxID=2772299 RepID=A0A927CM46_9BACL|nr:LysM domain-containing protein [Paenibacillus arenilitoris]MBD2870084.1 LysM peptidoglycan-binding domain-containing protein [Paenibacillus arenilitoris]